MGFALTLVYVALTILSPADLFPELAPYRIMLWLAVLCVLASIPSILRARWLRFPHSYLMLGVILAICLSRALNGWFGGVAPALADFLPVAVTFFLIVWNVTSVSRLRTLSLALIVIALYSVVRGIVAYHTNNQDDPFVMYQPVWIDYSHGLRTGYLRIRALGFLNDPNDFSQYLLMILPLLLPAWRAGRLTWNIIVVLAPAATLLYGVYLTFSRGALLGLALLILFLIKDRLGAKRSAILTPLVVAGVLLLNQSGRAMSMQDDSALGRVNAWSDGLGMFQSSPLWGIGYGLFTNHADRTAHNSFVLCLSELGLIGSFLWLSLLVTCVLYLQAFSRRRVSQSDAESVREGRWAFAIRCALYPVLITSWFLSRTYSTPLYLVMGLSAAISTMYPFNGPALAPRRNWAWVTAAVLPVLTAAVYATVRMRSL